MSALKPGTIKYECVGCGDCCRPQGAIPLRPEEAKDIASLPWEAEREWLNETGTVVQAKDEKGRRYSRLAKQDDGRSCIFLNEENRCLIHEVFGEDRKPAACKQFPRKRLSLDGQSIDHYSLLCRCVELLTDAEDVCVPAHEKADLYEKDLAIELKTLSKKNIQWPAFQDMWTDVMGLLASPDLDLVQSTRCVWKYFSMILEGDPNLESGAMMRRAFRETLPQRVDEMPFADKMDDTQRSLFFQLLYYCINPAPFDFFEKTVAVQALARQERLQIGEAFRDEQGSPLVNNESLDCTFAEVRAVEFPEEDGVMKGLLRAFLIAKGPTLRFHQESKDDALSSIHVLLLSLPQSIWLAKALAAHDKRTAATRDDLEKAIRIVDGGIGNVDSAMFKGNMREAWSHLFQETDFAAAAVAEFVTSECD